MATDSRTDYRARLEAEAEGDAVIVRFYAYMLEGSIEITASDARQLAASLTQSADFVESR